MGVSSSGSSSSADLMQACRAMAFCNVQSLECRLGLARARDARALWISKLKLVTEGLGEPVENLPQQRATLPYFECDLPGTVAIFLEQIRV